MIKCSRHITGDLEDLAGFLGVTDKLLKDIVQNYEKETSQAYQLLKAWMSTGNSDREELIGILEALDYTEAVNR